MRRMTYTIFGVLAVLSLMLAACAPVATPTAEPTVAVRPRPQRLLCPSQPRFPLNLPPRKQWT